LKDLKKATSENSTTIYAGFVHFACALFACWSPSLGRWVGHVRQTQICKSYVNLKKECVPQFELCWKFLNVFSEAFLSFLTKYRQSRFVGCCHVGGFKQNERRKIIGKRRKCIVNMPPTVLRP
jgi:hypothetical protein